MKYVELKLQENIDRSAAEQVAGDNAGIRDKPSMLVAWYDRDLDTGGPLDVCAGEHRSGVLDYAISHGAEVDVAVNNRRYEFFFLRPPTDTIELDRQVCLEAHNRLVSNTFDDVQGG